MLYIIYGTNIDKVRTQAKALVTRLQAKKPDASLFIMTDETWNTERVREYAGSQGLFEQKYIVYLDGVTARKEIKAELVDLLDEIKSSTNIFVLRAHDVDKVTLKKFEKFAEKIEEHSFAVGAAGTLAAGKCKPEFNIFSLGEALGRRDKKQLWTLYQKARASGLEPEQIHGTLWWQMKSICLAAQTVSASESGLNPFVHSKAKAYASNFTEDELTTSARTLIAVYHDARRGAGELEMLLEGWILA